tara:strand:+ start:6514 stop:7242 length:729 start_codon:yes stop_codon:yes gene_type:complete
MDIQYKLLEWDSSFFGFRIALINNKINNLDELNNILKSMKKDGVKLAYYFSNQINHNSQDIRKHKKEAFIDSRIKYIHNLDSNEERLELKHFNNVRLFKHKIPSKELISLAIESSYYSRFRRDKNFSNTLSDKLFSQWISNSVSNNSEDEVFIHREEDQILGFISTKTNDQSLTISLLAVSNKYRRKGIGNSLVSLVKDQAFKRNKKKVIVCTQNKNTPANTLYKSLGFTKYSEEDIYHFWL